MKLERNVEVVYNPNEKGIVMIKEILFTGRQKIRWDKVETYAKQYVGRYIEIDETGDIIYLGSDLPDEYSNSKYTVRLKGTMAKQRQMLYREYQK